MLSPVVKSYNVWVAAANVTIGNILDACYF